MTSHLLFDISPEERDGQAKKKPQRKQAREPVHACSPMVIEQKVSRFLAKVDGHYACDRCGLTTLDLIDTRIVDGKPQWLVTCGWSCLHAWLVDPVPGVLDEADREESRKPDFIVRGGRFDGKTFDQIAADGHEWYMQMVAAESKRSVLSSAASEWLKKNGLTPEIVRIR